MPKNPSTQPIVNKFKGYYKPLFQLNSSPFAVYFNGSYDPSFVGNPYYNPKYIGLTSNGTPFNVDLDSGTFEEVTNFNPKNPVIHGTTPRVNKFSAEGSSKKYQALRDVSWRRLLSNGQMVGHPINPNNPTSDYKQGDIIVGLETYVSYIDYSGKNPKNVTGKFIKISQDRYVPREAVVVYSGGKPVGVKDNFSGAEGKEQVLKYKVVKGTYIYSVSVGGQMNGLIVGATSPYYNVGNVISGKRKVIDYKDLNNGGAWAKGDVVELSPNKFVWKKDVVLYSGGKPAGYTKNFSGGHPTGSDSRQKARKCRRLNPDGTTTVYECPDSGHVFSADGNFTKGVDKGVLAYGITFGIMGIGVGILIGANTKAVAIITGSAVVVGAFVGYNKK